MAKATPTLELTSKRSPHVEHLNPQQFFTAIRCTEIKGSLMNDPDYYQPEGETPASDSSGLTATGRIRDGNLKPGSSHRKMPGNG